ncbi:MAG: hypothetical protein SFW65_04935 [Alphaproteobacteria bacterium]|nr:hypothetical protein [Alphaproteobacteria bacterium]
MSVAISAPALHHDIEPTGADAGNNAAAVCFQSAGQVVTVLGKLDRHFHDNSDLARFAKRAVAEYAAKRDTQIVSVVVTKDILDMDADNAKQITIGDEHYAVTIGDLRDGRSQMDHINRVIERLKYLQAVMVMLSTTDMLGTSQAVGKQMGGLNAKVQQVQKLGVKLEQFSKQVTQAQKEGKPIPAEALKSILTQLNRLNTAANPPEIRKIAQAMAVQVKELRQLPIMRQALIQTQNAKTQLHIEARNDAPIKTETRFKIPLKLLANKDAAGQPLEITTGTEPVKVTRHFIVLTPTRSEQIHTRIVGASNINQAARVQHTVAPAKNDNRFRAIQQPIMKPVEARQTAITAPERANVTPTTTQRFTVVSNTVKQAPVLTTLAQTGQATVQYAAAQSTSHVVQQPSIIPQVVQHSPQQAVQQTAQHVPQTQQPIQQTVQHVVEQTIKHAEPIQSAADQTVNTVQVTTTQEHAKSALQDTAPAQPTSHTTAVVTQTTKPEVQNTALQEPKHQPTEIKQSTDIKVSTGNANTNRVEAKPITDVQGPVQPQAGQPQETPRLQDAQRAAAHVEAGKATAPVDSVRGRLPSQQGTQPGQPPHQIDQLGNAAPKNLPDGMVYADNDSPTARGTEPRARTTPAKPNEAPPVGIPDQVINRQQPTSPEGDDKKPERTTPNVAKEFGSCGEAVCKCGKAGETPSARVTTPSNLPAATGNATEQKAEKPVTKGNIGPEFRESCGIICTCDLAKNAANPESQAPKGEREFGRRTRRASAPQANAA